MNLSNSESNLAKIEFCSISKSCFAFGMEIKSQVSQLSQKVLTAKLSIISSSSAKKQSAGVLGGLLQFEILFHRAPHLPKRCLVLQFVNLDIVQLAAQVT